MKKLFLVIFVFLGCGLLVKGLYLRFQQAKTEVAQAPIDFNSLSMEEQRRMVVNVMEFCILNYERESCLHYVIECGSPCANLLGPKSRARVRADYEALLKERNLPSMAAQRTIGSALEK